MQQVEITKNVRKWGNSAGILLPREWIGKEAKIILIDRTLEIKKEIFNILENYLEDILGIYLTGSYARKEQTKTSDIDMVVISKKVRKEIVSGKYHISVVPLEMVRKTIEKQPILILPRLMEAKSILNTSLIEELKTTKIKKGSFQNFILDTKRIIKINNETIKLDKLESRKNISSCVIYSLTLRLRGMFLMRCLLNGKKYSKKDFLNWLNTALNETELKKVYNIYEHIRDDYKAKFEVSIDVAEKLLNMLKKEVKNSEKKKAIRKRN